MTIRCLAEVAGAAGLCAVRTDSGDHRVAVIRVEVRGPPANGLLIELLEVARDKTADRLLGSATSAAELCTIVQHWLAHLADAEIR